MVESAKRALKFATVGVSDLDAKLFRALVVLLKRRFVGEWTVTDAANADLLVIGPNANPDERRRAQLQGKHGKHIELRRPRDPNVPGLYLPLISAEIQREFDAVATLLRQDDGLNRLAHVAPAAVQALPLEPAPAPMLSNQMPPDVPHNEAVAAETRLLTPAPADNFLRWTDASNETVLGLRLKLLRWPERGVLLAHPQFIKVAAVLTFTPLTLDEVVAKSGVTRDLCAQFAFAAISASQAQFTESMTVALAAPASTVAPNPATAPSLRVQTLSGPPSAALLHTQTERRNIFARIRGRLGL